MGRSRRDEDRRLQLIRAVLVASEAASPDLRDAIRYTLGVSLAVGAILGGKYRLEKLIGSGGAGEVFEATHLVLGSRVAVKVLMDAGPEEARHQRRKRFIREARVAASVQSDRVVRVFDIAAPDEGIAYIVMELLQGETLAQRVRRLGPLPVEDAIDCVLQVARPLAELHDAGIVHRDVKPSNIFVARDREGKEVVKLVDFGVAALREPVAASLARDSSITLADSLIGTPRYMAPEQIRDAKTVDARADVWGLGVVLYEIVAGGPAFDGSTMLAIFNQIDKQEPSPLASRRPDVPEELAAVVRRCLAKNPDDRPRDARAVAELLAPLVRDDAPGAANGALLSDATTTVDAPLVLPRRAGRRAAGHAAIAAVAAAALLVATAMLLRPRRAVDPPGAAMAPATEAAKPASTAIASADPADAPPLDATVAPAGAAPPREPSAPPTARRPASKSSTPAATHTRTTSPRSAKSADEDDRIE